MFTKDPAKLETKALDYERRGKTAKALKYREKAAKGRGGGLPLPATTAPSIYTTTTPVQQQPLQQSFQQQPLQQSFQQPQQSFQQPQQSFQQPQQSFQQPQQSFQQPQQSFQQPQQSFQQPQQSFQQPLQQQFQQPQQQFQQPLQQQSLQQQQQQQQQGFTTYRTPERYEQNALKWEQRGNWEKAQKNREKVWRIQNPQYGAQHTAPTFYDNQHRFLGYSLPVGQGFQQQGLQQQGFQQQPIGLQKPIGLQQQGLQQQAGLQQGATIHHVMPAVIETHQHAPILEQTTRAERIVEVQPVIHREVEAPEVHVIEKHMYEQVRSTGPSVITKGAIVEETVRPRIIEEIQPVVHREVPAPFIEHVEQHVTEHITQPTTMTKEIVNEQGGIFTTPGLAAGGPNPLGTAGASLAGAATGMRPGVPQHPQQQQQQRRF